MLIGRQTAVVSVGMSCQPAQQMRDQVELLSHLAGEVLTWRQGPFDWTIRGALASAAAIYSGEFAPDDPGELRNARDDDAARGLLRKPYWDRGRCWFWHVKGTVDQFRVKSNELGNAWNALGDMKRIVFVWANTQNNLVRHVAEFGGYQVVHASDDLHALAIQLRLRFREQAELHVVTRPGRFSAARMTKAKVWAGCPTRIRTMAKDETQWQGDPGLWEDAFRSMFEPQQKDAMTWPT